MVARRDASVLEAKALAHPLRVQLLTMLGTEEQSTSELARRLDVNPGTVLYHLRVLQEAEFVAATAERVGRRGARTVPYRATGRAKSVSFRNQPDAGAAIGSSIMQGALASYFGAEVQARFGESVATLRLTADRLEEFQLHMRNLVDEFRDEEGEPVTMMIAFHR